MARNATVWVQFEIDGAGKESAADIIGQLLDGGSLQMAIEGAGRDLLIASASVVTAGINPVRAAHAAPDLLAALVALRDWTDESEVHGREEGSPVPPSTPSWDATIKMVRAAIAKARGQ